MDAIDPGESSFIVIVTSSLVNATTFTSRMSLDRNIVIKIMEKVYPLPAKLRAALSPSFLSLHLRLCLSSASNTERERERDGRTDGEGRKKISDAGESAARAGIYTRGDSVIYERRCSSPLLSLPLSLSLVLSIRPIDSSPEQGRVLDRSRRD